MMIDEIEVGKWYAANYGFEVVIGQCKYVVKHQGQRGCVLAFRWGTIFREKNFVDYGRVIGEVDDPRIIVKIIKLLKMIFNKKTYNKIKELSSKIYHKIVNLSIKLFTYIKKIME